MIYEIQQLNYRYPSSDRMILCDIDMSVSGGEILTILGKNGAGKSTLLMCMLRLLKPASGKIMLDGSNINDLSERDIAKTVGYVPQIHIPSFPFSVLEFVMMGTASGLGFFEKPSKREREISYQALEALGIDSLSDKPYTNISGGERQKATIARAIVSKPQVILFDEPTAHLDYGSQLLVLKTIKELSEKGFSIVITTHNPDHALLLGGQSALMSSEGSLVVGKTDDILTQESLSRIYDTDIRLEYIDTLCRKACIYSNL
ncbi:MAG: ABC transporter ATP-binding protein [Oscillospiraceae bacterium]|nr:ABC transporter ATP-binding protein [Oscillospiraceae bacterium]